MLAYSAVFWPVARSATKSDEYCGVLKVMAMNVGFRRVLSVNRIFRQSRNCSIHLDACSSDWYAHTLLMRLLFKVEDVFDITGRGCVLASVVPDGLDFKIRAEDRIQLRTPSGRLVETHIASIELLKIRDGPCRMAIMLPRELTKSDVPVGTEIWYILEG